MTPEQLESYKKAGKIAVQVLDYGTKLVKSGEKYIDVIEKIEAKIIELGAKPAFPVTLSNREIAAHYSSIPNDESMIEDNAVICIDVGVHIDGFIGDNAATVDVSEKYTDLVKASREALNNVMKILQIGTSYGEIGKTIAETIESFGYEPIRNLSGHGLAQYQQHAGKSIPNYDTGDKTEIKPGQTFAIEPFATDGEGLITEKGDPCIYMIKNRRPVRNMMTRSVLQEIDKFHGLPFSPRWLVKEPTNLPLAKVNFGLRDLTNQKIVKAYPPLVEKKAGIVTQAENSFYADEDKIEVTTRV